MSNPRTNFRIQGGIAAYRERLARLNDIDRRHTPTALPRPDAAHYQRLAATKRREADTIARDIRTGVDDLASRFARRRAKELLDEADRYEALAQQQEGDPS